LLHTVGPKALRIEVTASERPQPIDIVDRASGAPTLVFPHNRSFLRVPSADSPREPGNPLRPGMPPGRASAAGLPAMPAMPAIPRMPGAMPLEIKATGEKKKLLGLDCEKLEMQQRGRTLEIWATAQLFPFQPYVQSQRSRFGPRMMEEQWAELVTARKLFPVRAVLRSEGGGEEVLWDVKAVTPRKVTDEHHTLFAPPAGYFEARALPF
jgi:hypothetical protein